MSTIHFQLDRPDLNTALLVKQFEDLTRSDRINIEELFDLFYKLRQHGICYDLESFYEGDFTRVYQHEPMWNRLLHLKFAAKTYTFVILSSAEMDDSRSDREFTLEDPTFEEFLLEYIDEVTDYEDWGGPSKIEFTQGKYYLTQSGTFTVED